MKEGINISSIFKRTAYILLFYVIVLGFFSNSMYPVYAETGTDEYIYEVDRYDYEVSLIKRLSINNTSEAGLEPLAGYCFQMKKSWPASATKYKKLDATPGNLAAYVADDAALKDKPALLMNHIGKVVCLGHPRNEKGLLDGFTEEQRVEITQTAVWWFTDEYTESYESGIFSKESWIEHCLDDSVFGEKIERAREVLAYMISEDDLEEYKDVHVSVFVPENSEYQVILSVYKLEATGQLTISKTVQGSGGDYSRGFDFEIHVTDQNGVDINGDFMVINNEGISRAITFINGVSAINLKHNESIKIVNLPDNFRYSVEETDAQGYSTECTKKIDGIQSQDSFLVNQVSRQVIGQGTDVELSWENRKDIEIPTGIDSIKTIKVVLLIIMINALVLLKKKGCKE